VEQVDEVRLELAVPLGSRHRVIAALRASHPYEEPAFSLLPNTAPGREGLGRVGLLGQSMTLAAFVDLVAAALPVTAVGVRASGPPNYPVRTVAVAAGACADLGPVAAGAGADVLVTADVRHHVGLDAPVPLVDVTHWASEWPWLQQAADVLTGELPGLVVEVSRLRTDPWQLHRHGDL
jgi:putative NIF3 family GTP cyclohydrolase 1 type 2